MISFVPLGKSLGNSFPGGISRIANATHDLEDRLDVAPYKI